MVLAQPGRSQAEDCRGAVPDFGSRTALFLRLALLQRREAAVGKRTGNMQLSVRVARALHHVSVSGASRREVLLASILVRG